MWKLTLILLLISALPLEATSMWGRKSKNLTTVYSPEFMPGDIIMVTIKEQSTAQNNFKSQVSDEVSVNSDMWGRLRDIISLANIKPVNKVLNTLNNTLSNQNQTSDQEGEGKMTANTKLETFITVMVKKVLPGGNLSVEGNKSVLVNGEKQIVSLSGIVRPEDIMDNSIDSGKVANAQINFSGKGAYDGVRKPGILQRMMNVLF